MGFVISMKSLSGVFVNQFVSQGAGLDGLYENRALTESGVCYVLNEDSTYPSDTYDSDPWIDAFGKVMPTAPFTDGVWHDVVIFEFQIQKPENATYFKQTLVVKGQQFGLIEPHGSAGNGYTYLTSQLRVSGFYRREYSDAVHFTETLIELTSFGSTPHVYSYDIDGMYPDRYSYMFCDTRTLIGFSSGMYGGNKIWGAFIYWEGYRNDYADENSGRWVTFGRHLAAIKQSDLNEYFGLFEPEADEEDPNLPPDDPEQPPSGPSDPEFPPHETPQDPIPIPPKPGIGAGDAGFLTLYHLSAAEMFVFGQDCFASDVWEAIRLFFSNPIDFIAGCNLLPFSPPGTAMWHPKFGIKTFAHSYARVSDQYVDIDCGNLRVPEYWKSFLDYEPFTRMLIWLPYIGYRELPVDDVMNNSIHVMYRCDCLTGDCIAFVERSAPRMDPSYIGPTAGQVFAQYSGNCAVRVPFASASFDAAIQASVNLLTCGASTAIAAAPSSTTTQTTDSAGEMTESIVNNVSGGINVGGLIGAAADTVLSMKPEVQRGGAVGGTGGQMGIQYPYIIVVRPRKSLPEMFKNLKGYPLNASGTLSQLGSGYAEVEDIQLNNIPAMMTERQEIVSMLRKGVII